MGTYIKIVLLSLAVWWMFQETEIEKKFEVEVKQSSQTVYNILKNPRNLEKIHPKIQNITKLDIHDHVITFNFKESYLLLDLTFSMKVTTDDSKLELSYQTISSIADVRVELHIRQSGTVNPGQTSAQPSATVDVRIAVSACRILTYIISSHLAQVWSQVVLATQDFIPLADS